MACLDKKYIYDDLLRFQIVSSYAFSLQFSVTLQGEYTGANFNDNEVREVFSDSIEKKTKFSILN